MYYRMLREKRERETQRERDAALFNKEGAKKASEASHAYDPETSRASSGPEHA